MNIFDRARQLIAQSPRPMDLSRAMQLLGRRRRKKAQPLPVRPVRLPYRDD